MTYNTHTHAHLYCLASATLSLPLSVSVSILHVPHPPTHPMLSNNKQKKSCSVSVVVPFVSFRFFCLFSKAYPFPQLNPIERRRQHTFSFLFVTLRESYPHTRNTDAHPFPLSLSLFVSFPLSE